MGLDNITKTSGFSSGGAKKLEKMAQDTEMYTEFLKFQGRVFKHKSSVALEFFTQKPDAQFIATREQWERLHYTLQAGTSGLRFVDENGNQTELYDFSQIEEDKKPHVWTLNKQNASIVKSEMGIPDKEGIITGTLRQMNIPEIADCMKTLHIPPQNFTSFRKSFMNAVHLIMAGRLEVGSNSFKIPANPEAFQMLKTDSERLSFLTYVANTANRALMKIETTVQDIYSKKFAERNQQMQEIEQNQSKKPNTLEELQELVRISVEISMQEKEFTRLFHEEEKQYEKIATISQEIADLKQAYQTLSQKIKQQNVTPEDIAMLRQIYPKRISVQNLPESEIAWTVKFQRLLDSELGEKSPYQMRQTDNAWRDQNKMIPVIQLKKRDISDVREDVKKGVLERGDFVNQDTGITINYGRASINDSFFQNSRKNSVSEIEVQQTAMYQMRDLIENAVQFDTQLSDNTKKSPNSLFMHKLYAVFQYENNYYLANISVDESYTTDKEGKLNDKKLYHAKSIKITPIENLGFQSYGTKSETSDNGESTSVTELSISQLYQIVKTYDKNFFENPNAPGREAREAEIYTHAQYLDAENAQNNENHVYTPTETQKQVAKIAETHGLSQEDTISMLEKVVRVYSRFPADNKTSADISANFDVDFAVKVQAAFEEVAQNRKLSPHQQEFMEALKDFAITNHVSNDLIDKALADCSRFQSQYTNKKWISQHIFYGRLTRTENELQAALKKYLPNAKADANTNFSDRHHAFEKVITKYALPDTAQEILHLVEEQMRKNHYTSLVPIIFRMPDFQQYGSQQNIDESVFGGRLKEIIAEINENLQSEQKEIHSEKVDTSINFSEQNTSLEEPEQEEIINHQEESVAPEPEKVDTYSNFSEQNASLEEPEQEEITNHQEESVAPEPEKVDTYSNFSEQNTSLEEPEQEETTNHQEEPVALEPEKTEIALGDKFRNKSTGEICEVVSLTGALPWYTDECAISRKEGTFEITQNISKSDLLDSNKYEYISEPENIIEETIYDISDISQQNQKLIETIEIGDEITLHGNTFVVESITNDFMMKMDIKDTEKATGSISSKQYIGNWKEDLLQDAGNELLSIRKSSEMQNELISNTEPETANRKTYPIVSVKAGWNYNRYISPELEEKEYTIPEFNEALKKLNERWNGEEYETKSAYVTLTIHLSETESYEKRLNAEYQFESLSQRLEYDNDLFNSEQELRKAVHEAEKSTIIASEETKKQSDEQLQNENISPINHNKTRSERLYEKFTELFPEIADGTHEYERYGNYDENGGIEPLSVEHLGGDTYAMMSYYTQNGDLMHDPDFTFNLNEEAKRLEILEY